jgi:hypothetical protein
VHNSPDLEIWSPFTQVSRVNIQIKHRTISMSDETVVAPAAEPEVKEAPVEEKKPEVTEEAKPAEEGTTSK